MSLKNKKNPQNQKRHCLDKHGLIKLFIITLPVAAKYIQSFK